MGYQMVAYGYDRYGDEIWDKTLRYGVRNAYMLTFSTSVALRKFYGTGEGILFRDAFADLNRFWDSLPKSRIRGAPSRRCRRKTTPPILIPCP